MSASGTIPSRAASIVGVDVGGTFTDLFLFDEAKRGVPHSQSPVPPRRRSLGLPRRPRRSRAACERRVHRPRHHRRHQRAARTQGRTRRPDHHAGFRDVLEMRRRDRRIPGASGASSCPSSTAHALEVAERILADGTFRPALDPARGPSGRAHAHRQTAPKPLAIVFINAFANPANERRAAAAAARPIWPNEHIAISQPDPAGDPRIRAQLHHGAQRLSPARRRLLSRQARGCACREGGFTGDFHIVQSNGGVMSTATARRLAGPHRALRPRRRRHRAARDRARRGLPRTSSPAISAAPPSTCP